MQKVLSPEEGVEYRRLYNQFTEAVVRAGKILQTHGMGSAEFLEADSAAGAIKRRMMKLIGDTSSNWMA